MSKLVNFFQEGGEMAPAPEEQAQAAAPAEAGGDPLQQLLQMAMQAVNTQDGQLALQVCEMLLEIAGASGQGAAQAYRNGGILMRKSYR